MTDRKSALDIALDAIDEGLAAEITARFRQFSEAINREDKVGGLDGAIRRFDEMLPTLKDLHERARAKVTDTF